MHRIFGVLLAGTMFAGELPVKRVVLYKHGVGYFERTGEMAAGETARLDFKAPEMNDVLKSLTIEEAGGGKVTGVRYDSSMPLDKRLSEYPFQVGPQVTLAQFLDQFKGSRLEGETGGQKTAGAIVSGRINGPTADQPQKELLVILTDAGELRTLELSAVSSLKFSDASLQQQLRDYLGAVAGARTREQRSVYIDSTDSKIRRLTASYLIPTPVWKSSYRLVFREQGQPLLEGWAIIDNTTNDDWTNIRLSLVSGKPVSFQSRLYDPKFIERPFAELAEDKAAAPVVYAGALGPRAAAPAAPMMARQEMAKSARGAMMDVQAMTMAEMTSPGESSVGVSAEGRELGELFEYAFGAPVTVRRNQSAMLPFLQQPIDGRKLLIYSDRSAINPRTAAELANNTGKTLDGGPITVFDNNAYAGEALVETVKTGDKRLISYGVDLGTRVTTNIDSGAKAYREFHLRRGVLTARAGVEETTTYSIQNVDARAKTLIIEHPLRSNYKLLNQKPVETTAAAHRFSVAVKASGSDSFVVKEDRTDSEALMISSMTPQTLATFVENRALTAAGRQTLEKIHAQKRQIAEVDAAIRAAEQKINENTADQDRLRRNISSLNSVSGQQEVVQRYARDLAAREQQIVALRDSVSADRQKKAGLESALNTMIEQAEF